ncbi:hypothetical protein NDU88_005052 [Pleurodeles waltl]|uniref:Uncharacterized protein n=1 Tax=Pleurodeles waltl TaxID=8319 RepID=A0AAV7PEU3_PLEWA|nr:hypothetical protein NDU88_005052 [Pleurodeles waltl]
MCATRLCWDGTTAEEEEVFCGGEEPEAFEKFPHCAKDLWLYEPKIHEAYRQFAGDAWLDYDKSFRFKKQAHPDMERDEEDVSSYMHKMMVTREGRPGMRKHDHPFRKSQVQRASGQAEVLS